MTGGVPVRPGVWPPGAANPMGWQARGQGRDRQGARGRPHGQGLCKQADKRLQGCGKFGHPGGLMHHL